MSTLIASYSGTSSGYNAVTPVWPAIVGTNITASPSSTFGTQITINGKTFIRGGTYTIPITGVNLAVGCTVVLFMAYRYAQKFLYGFDNVNTDGLYADTTFKLWNGVPNDLVLPANCWATPMCIVVEYKAASVVVSVGPCQMTVGSASSGTPNNLNLGQGFVFGAIDADWYGAMVFDGVLTAGNITTINTFATGLGFDRTVTKVMLLDGDSQPGSPSSPAPASAVAPPTGALGFDSGSDYFPISYLATAMGYPLCVSVSHSGEIVSQIDTAAGTDIDPNITQIIAKGVSAANVRLDTFMLTNNIDPLIGNQAATTARAELVTYISNRLTANPGITIKALQVLNRSGWDATVQGRQNTLNASTVGSLATAVIIATGNATYTPDIYVYNSTSNGTDSADGIHCKNSGSQKVANFILWSETKPLTSTMTIPSAGTTIALTFSQPLLTATAANAGGWTLSGTTRTVSSWAVGGTTGTLTLSGAVLQGATVTSDNDASWAVTNPNLNAMASISGASVTNNSTQQPPTPGGVGAAALAIEETQIEMMA